MAKNKPIDHDALLKTLQQRFTDNPSRHKGLDWDLVAKRLQKNPQKLSTIATMEETGGEPDVIGQDKDSGAIIFCDCSAESPSGRRSLCFDEAALAARKKNKPVGSVEALAQSMDAQLLTEKLYRNLQKLGEFDLKTSSWVASPDNIRKLGGALFCDRRYGTVFVYHNGADSYYAARGFRCYLEV